MNNRNMNRKKKFASAQRGSINGNNKRRFPINKDAFFDGDERKRRRRKSEEEEIASSSSSSDEEEQNAYDDEEYGSGDGEEEEIIEEEETAEEKKKRLAVAHVERLRALVSREDEDREEDEESEDEERSKIERDGRRDSLVAKILQQEQLEDSGRVRRALASRVKKPETADEFQVLVKHRQSVTAVALSEDDLKGFSSSKDGSILHWDLETGKSEKYLWPSDEVLKSHGAKEPQGRATKHSRQVLALSVSSDGRYLASGGLDRHVHLWDTRTRQHVQAFPGHKGPVSCLAFRQGSPELFSGSFDRSIKIWSMEDRVYINTLFGHQSEVLTIDCLRKERVLTVGRDRTMHLFKVPEESQLIYRAPASSLECCCFVNNDEFLSGSDDGSIQHWNVIRKKPVHIVKNAHVSISEQKVTQTNDALSNGQIGASQGPDNIYSSVFSWVSSIAVCRSSDLAASGAGNGSIRLWAIERESKGISPLFELPVVGFVNSLAFAKSGRFLVAGVGQEPRLGRWGRIPEARNGVAVHFLKFS